MRVEVNVTHVCNATCLDCNRAIGLANFRNLTMTREDMKLGIDKMLAKGWKVKRMTLAGGEPLLNPNLQGILDETTRLTTITEGRVLTNDLVHDERRTGIRLPKNWRWIPAPLDDPEDVKSGKSAHLPFFCSPKDNGMKSQWQDCTVRGYCGKGFDRFGFSMCGVASTLGRLLGINPYVDKPTYAEEATPGICEHCVYGMSRRRQKNLYQLVNDGKADRISKTYREGIHRHKESPMEFVPLVEKAEQTEPSASK